MNITCPGCGGELEIGADGFNRHIECECGTRFMVAEDGTLTILTAKDEKKPIDDFKTSKWKPNADALRMMRIICGFALFMLASTFGKDFGYWVYDKCTGKGQDREYTNLLIKEPGIIKASCVQYRQKLEPLVALLSDNVNVWCANAKSCKNARGIIHQAKCAAQEMNRQTKNKIEVYSAYRGKTEEIKKVCDNFLTAARYYETLSSKMIELTNAMDEICRMKIKGASGTAAEEKILQLATQVDKLLAEYVAEERNMLEYVKQTSM